MHSAAYKVSPLSTFLLNLRPAPLASAASTLFRLNRRRSVYTNQGTFFINPISNFGSAMLQGQYEPHMAVTLSQYLSAGGVFIDLGANEGYFSVLASRLVGPKGTVIAVEPQSRLQSVIQENLALNQCCNVRLIKCVVSDVTCRKTLSLAPSVNTGSSSLFRPTKYSLPTEDVQSFSLGDLLPRIGVESCDLMKVDIEGAEYDVFMSATEILKKGTIRHIALEFHDSILRKRGLSPDALHNKMIDSGYSLTFTFGTRLYSSNHA